MTVGSERGAVQNPCGGGRRTLPYVFTEHGTLMAADVLNSERAVEMSVYVIRAFVSMRRELTRDRDLASRLAEMERTLIGHSLAEGSTIDEILADFPTLNEKDVRAVIAFAAAFAKADLPPPTIPGKR